MAFPNDLKNVAAFKIHPAIGVARVANNPSTNTDYYYEFFAQQALPRVDRKYMSDVDRVPTMKRQAVQFKVFAYDESLNELGELTAAAMQTLKLKATWSASLGNRKIYNYGQKGGSPKTSPITATGSATGSDSTDLEGINPFDSTKKVTLGSINGTGLFIPGEGGVVRETTQSKISPFPADQGYPLNTSDTTSDGSIGLALSGTDLPVIPAAVICASQEHSPDVNVAELLAARTLNPSNPTFGNEIWTKVVSASNMLNIPYPSTPTGEGEKMDAAMNATMNGDFFPGVENCLDYSGGRTEFTNQAEIKKLFYPSGTGLIGKSEIRPKYDAQNALPGQLTSGLCSTWQGDLVACLAFWTAEYPNKVIAQPKPPGDTKILFREKCDNTSKISTPDGINEYADQMGVSRNDSIDPRIINFDETERNCTT